MRNGSKILNKKLSDLVRKWEDNGLPGRDTMVKTGRMLANWKQDGNVQGLWEHPPHLMTATLDDAWGHGLDLIELYATVAGLHVFRVGLLKSAGDVIDACRDRKPDFLGITVLQFDSEDDLCTIGRNIPADTRLIVGGPIFRADPDIAVRANVHLVAGNLAVFVKFLLSTTTRRHEPENNGHQRC
jgi:hypothetical protein